MQTHVVELTKKRLSDFFVKEDGHVAHKNALAASTVATGAIFAALCSRLILQRLIILAVIQPAMRSNIAYPAKTETGTGTMNASDGC